MRANPTGTVFPVRPTQRAVRLGALLLAFAAASFSGAAPLPLSRGDAPSEARPGPALVLAPESGTWDLSAYDSVFLRLANPGDTAVTVWARAEMPDAKGMTDACSAVAVVPAKGEATLRLRLMRRPEDPGYEPFKRFYMYTKSLRVRDNTVDPTQIARVALKIEGEGSVRVLAATADGAGTPGQPKFFPFIDRYGQYKHTDWPGKIHDDADFAERLREEEAEMHAHPGPPDWNRYGGWANGPRQEATGFFHTKKIDGKWWFVDPEGCLYWSYGPTGVGLGGEGSPVTGKENWFEELPAKDGPYARYWEKGRGARFMYYEDGKAWDAFNFSGLVAEKKYGKDWESGAAERLHARLRNWGYNSVGNWSERAVMEARKTPYTVAIWANEGNGAPMLDHIPDVFDPRWERALAATLAKEKGRTAGDPWNIGYFVDNEWTWGWAKNGAIVIHNALKFPGSATKARFVEFLRTRHADIAALNQAWGTNYASWDALRRAVEPPWNPAARATTTKEAFLERQRAQFADIAALNAAWRTDYASWDDLASSVEKRPDLKTPAVENDCGEFGLQFAEHYFSTVRRRVKEVAPNNLYLGVRFHGHIDTALVQICAKYADVISWNVYESDPGARLNRFIGVVDKPFLSGEFGIDSDPLQTPFRGDAPNDDPNRRIRSMESYVRKAFVHPLMVGAHYFQFRDQPLSGRPDGEAVLRGFMNLADTPHFDLVQANRKLGYGLYRMRAEGR